MNDDMTAKKCGFVTIIGAPNAGKSSFVNAMVGTKISIVTHKVQTTRTRVRGVLLQGNTQIVFVDTPGIFSPKRRLDRAMVAAAWDGVESSDAIVLMVDAPSYIAGKSVEKADGAARRAAADTDAIIEEMKRRSLTSILAINKLDKLPREKMLALTAELNEHGVFSEIFYVSATRGDGMQDIKSHLIGKMPDGEWMYPEDQLSDISDRLMAAEVTREKVFLRLHQELPYEITVETESWERTKKNELRLEQTIFVARDSQKGIVLGKNGQTIKSIGASAREELEEIFDEKVHLFVHVKVRENWLDEPARYREMGLDIVN